MPCQVLDKAVNMSEGTEWCDEFSFFSVVLFMGYYFCGLKGDANKADKQGWGSLGKT